MQDIQGNLMSVGSFLFIILYLTSEGIDLLSPLSYEIENCVCFVVNISIQLVIRIIAFRSSNI